MNKFDLIAGSLSPDNPNSLMPRVRAAAIAYLHSFGLPHSHDDIEDVCSQLRVKALEHADQWGEQSPLEGWLVLIVFNLVRATKNKDSRRRTTPVSQLPVQSGEAEALSEIEFFDSMKAQANERIVNAHRKPTELPLPSLETLLPSLSANSQQLLRLSITEGWEVSQIMGHLGKKRGAIDTGLCRARSELHKAYLKWKRDIESFEDTPRNYVAPMNTSSKARVIGGAFPDES